MLSAAVNNARIPLECIADVTHVASGRTQRIAMGASCKTEACFVPEDIWRGAAEGLSADFVPIGSLDSDAWLVVKSYDTRENAGPKCVFHNSFHDPHYDDSVGVRPLGST